MKSCELIVLKIFGVLYCLYFECLRYWNKVVFIGYGVLGRLSDWSKNFR